MKTGVDIGWIARNTKRVIQLYIISISPFLTYCNIMNVGVTEDGNPNPSLSHSRLILFFVTLSLRRDCRLQVTHTMLSGGYSTHRLLVFETICHIWENREVAICYVKRYVYAIRLKKGSHDLATFNRFLSWWRTRIAIRSKSRPPYNL